MAEQGSQFDYLVQQEVSAALSATEEIRVRLERMAARLTGVGGEAVVSEHLATAVTHVGEAATALAAAALLLPAAQEEVVFDLPPEVKDRLLADATGIIRLNMANADRDVLSSAGGHLGGIRKLRDMYMFGSAGLAAYGLGELTLGRIGAYLQSGVPPLPPLPERGDVALAAQLYDTSQEVPCRVVLGELQDKLLARGVSTVGMALRGLRSRLDFSMPMREGERVDVERAIALLEAFTADYDRVKRTHHSTDV